VATLEKISAVVALPGGGSQAGDVSAGGPSGDVSAGDDTTANTTHQTNQTVLKNASERELARLGVLPGKAPKRKHRKKTETMPAATASHRVAEFLRWTKNACVNITAATAAAAREDTKKRKKCVVLAGTGPSQPKSCLPVCPYKTDVFFYLS